jgi:flagellar biosynthesis/type III secretory pathway chaperone
VIPLAFQQLLDIMAELEQLHQEVLDMAEQKKQVLIRNDINELNRIVHKEHQLLKQIGESEDRRKEAIDRFLIARGFRPNPLVTVKDLIKLAFKADDKMALMGAQAALSSTLIKLKEANALNQKLLEQSLMFVNHSLDLIIGVPDDDVIYQKPTIQGQSLKRPVIFYTRA